MKASRFFVLSVAALFAACTVSLLHAEEEEANGAAASPSTSEAAPAYLGVLLGPVPDALAAHLEVEGGALLAQVVPGSPAAQAGLARYDVIVKAGGREVDSPDALAAWIRERTAGTEVELEARRGREVVHARVTLG
jgi:S1-C subfamily serine protease